MPFDGHESNNLPLVKWWFWGKAPYRQLRPKPLYSIAPGKVTHTLTGSGLFHCSCKVPVAAVGF